MGRPAAAGGARLRRRRAQGAEGRGAGVGSRRAACSRGSARCGGVGRLRDRVPRAARMLQKAGLGGERPLYLCYVQKRNEHGKVQKRALLLTDAAIYNADTTVEKLKRRVPLESIASVTADESSGQFVLHVPSEYDYFFAGESSGYDASEGGGAAATSSIGVIDALQRAYTSIAASAAGAQRHRRRRRPRRSCRRRRALRTRGSRRRESRTMMTVTE